MNKESYSKKIAYNKDYNRNNYKAYTFRLNRVSDADLIECLDNMDTVQFIRKALKEFIAKHTLMQNLKSRKNKRIGFPYEVYTVTEDGFRELIGSAEDLDNAKDIRDAAYSRSSHVADCIIVKRYMNKYGTVVAMKVTA